MPFLLRLRASIRKRLSHHAIANIVSTGRFALLERSSIVRTINSFSEVGNDTLARVILGNNAIRTNHFDNVKITRLKVVHPMLAYGMPRREAEYALQFLYLENLTEDLHLISKSFKYDFVCSNGER